MRVSKRKVFWLVFIVNGILGILPESTPVFLMEVIAFDLLVLVLMDYPYYEEPGWKEETREKGKAVWRKAQIVAVLLCLIDLIQCGIGKGRVGRTISLDAIILCLSVALLYTERMFIQDRENKKRKVGEWIGRILLIMIGLAAGVVYVSRWLYAFGLLG